MLRTSSRCLVRNLRLYEVLGVSPSATEKEIKDTFKQLARKHHPDAGGDAEKFKQVAEAYRILSDPQQRRNYDNQDESEISENFRSHRRQTPPTQLRLQLPLEDFLLGTRKTLKFARKTPCRPCDGVGGDAVQCGQCGGVGSFFVKRGNFVQQVACQTCASRGYVVSRVCSHCRGVGVVTSSESLDVVVSPGDLPGDRQVFPGRGDQLRGCDSGDVLVFLSALPHPNFQRLGLGRDLLVHVTRDLLDALTATDFRLKCLGERNIRVLCDRLVGPGDVLKLRGHGLPGGGDLFVKIAVDFPQSTRQVAQLVAQVTRVLAENPKKDVEVEVAVRARILTDEEKRRLDEVVAQSSEEPQQRESERDCVQQ